MAWQKGKSGNPGGRPRGAPGLAIIQTIARKYTERAVSTLARCLDSDDERVQVAAAVAILDRGWGKPAQAVELSGSEGGPLVIEIVKYGGEAKTAIVPATAKESD